VNDALAIVHIPGPFWTSDPTWVKPGLVLIIHVWAVGASVVILLAALMNVPQHLYEASAMDGASSWRRFWDVTVPMISPALFFIVIINTISALQTFDQVYTAFFNASTPYGTDASLFYVIYLFQEAFVYFRMGYASALAWILFLIIMFVTVVQILVSRRYVYYEGERR
jgi:multiple sugar transport system permease protein